MKTKISAASEKQEYGRGKSARARGPETGQASDLVPQARSCSPGFFTQPDHSAIAVN
jgi:hypothetical protein